MTHSAGGDLPAELETVPDFGAQSAWAHSRSLNLNPTQAHDVRAAMIVLWQRFPDVAYCPAIVWLLALCARLRPPISPGRSVGLAADLLARSRRDGFFLPLNVDDFRRLVHAHQLLLKVRPGACVEAMLSHFAC